MYTITKLGTACMKPTVSYTTNFLWCGNKCLNPDERTCRTLHHQADGSVKIEGHPYPNVLDRIDYREEVRVCRYADGSFSENAHLFTPSSRTKKGSTS